MKRALLALFGCCCLGGSALAQTYSIDWFSIDGGGGTVAGGTYSISSTIGQADGGHLSGGNFTIEGGFWSVLGAVQTPGAPVLRVVRSTTNTVVIAWPTASSAGFSLQQNPVANSAASWIGVTNVPALIGSENQVIIAPPAGNKFFRLKSP